MISGVEEGEVAFGLYILSKLRPLLLAHVIASGVVAAGLEDKDALAWSAASRCKDALEIELTDLVVKVLVGLYLEAGLVK